MKKKTAKPDKRAGKRAAHPDPNRYPKGWDRKRVQALAEYYENQSDEEAIAELDAAFDNERTAMIQVPIELVPKVQKLLAKRAG